MMVVISGEGSTDVGTTGGQNFLPGPMALFVDKWIEKKVQYSLLEVEMFRFIPKSKLNKESKNIRAITRRGKKNPRETRLFYKNARALAMIAGQVMQEEDTPVMAVLFRDSDGTRTAGRGEWNDKRMSMMKGFAAEQFDYGVPMIPKPKSEAWILCALRDQYDHCHKLENESGNDNSPNSLKIQLEAFLGEKATRVLLVGKIHDGLLDMERIDMPSMQAFKDRCDEVLGKLG